MVVTLGRFEAMEEAQAEHDKIALRKQYREISVQPIARWMSGIPMRVRDSGCAAVPAATSNGYGRRMFLSEDCELG